MPLIWGMDTHIPTLEEIDARINDLRSEWAALTVLRRAALARERAMSAGSKPPCIRGGTRRSDQPLQRDIPSELHKTTSRDKRAGMEVSNERK